MDADELDWNRTLREQWEFHWNHELRARLDGLRRRAGGVARDLAYTGSAATALDQLEARLVWLAGLRGPG